MSEVPRAVKDIAKKAGQLTQKTANAAQQFAEEHHVKERVVSTAENLKSKAKQNYEEKTGRSASTDADILKMSAVATAGAIAITAAPAIVVGGAVAAAVVLTAKENAAHVQESLESNYVAVTKRDAGKDKLAIRSAAEKAKNVAVEIAHDFQSGMTSEKQQHTSTH
jgi:hypothetical protein